MSRDYIASTLKRLRETTGLTADQVGAMIGKSGKTVNAWENGRGQPDAEILIKLCSIYKVNNILEEFDDSNIIANQSNFSQTEISFIKKYRVLDEHGKDMVDTVLDKEYSRCAEETSRIKAYTANMAAGTGSEGLTEKKIKEMEAFGKLVREYENKSE